MSVTAAFVLGSGRWAAMGLLLARSLSEFTHCKQFILVPSAEAEAIPAAIREECERHGRIVEAPAVAPAYPIATKLQAFQRAAEAADTGSVVLFDTDTLVVDALAESELTSAALAARPANFAARRWETGMGEVLDPELFDAFGYRFPDESVTGAVDDKPMAASWNAGVVATTDHSLPETWLDLTLAAHDRMETPRFADQLALAMLAADRGITPLPEADNFPAAFRFRFPPDVRVLHYHGVHHLLRIRTPPLRDRFRRLGVSAVVDRYVDEPVYTTGLKRIGTNLTHRLVGW